MRELLIVAGIYLLVPVFLGLAAGTPSRFHSGKRMREVFDFSADIMYPWRWNKMWKRIQKKDYKYEKSDYLY